MLAKTIAIEETSISEMQRQRLPHKNTISMLSVSSSFQSSSYAYSNLVHCSSGSRKLPSLSLRFVFDVRYITLLLNQLPCHWSEIGKACMLFDYVLYTCVLYEYVLCDPPYLVWSVVMTKSNHRHNDSFPQPQEPEVPYHYMSRQTMAMFHVL